MNGYCAVDIVGRDDDVRVKVCSRYPALAGVITDYIRDVIEDPRVRSAVCQSSTKGGNGECFDILVIDVDCYHEGLSADLISLIKQDKSPRCILISDFFIPAYQRMHEAGLVDLCVPRRIDIEGLIKALVVTLSSTADDANKHDLQRSLQHQFLPDLTKLTKAEMKVYRQISFGYSYKHVSAKMELAESTIKAHMVRILRKTGYRNRIHASVMWQHIERIGYHKIPVTGGSRVEPLADIGCRTH